MTNLEDRFSPIRFLFGNRRGQFGLNPAAGCEKNTTKSFRSLTKMDLPLAVDLRKFLREIS